MIATARCPRCAFQNRVCLCGDLPTVTTRTRVRIVRHAKERHKPSNTGRLAHYCLPNSELVEYGGPGAAPPELAAPGAWLLFPEGTPSTSPPPASTLVVLDGTWQQARRMRQRIPSLSGMPILSLPGAPGKRMRTSPVPDGLSTLEAIAHALALLEGADVAAPLLALHALAVERSAVSARI